jgi:glutathione S-transferase
MKLYFSPSACSLAQHIALREAGLKFDLEKVDLAAKKTASGADYWAINPKGYVPALQLDDGNVLTENQAIAQWIADQSPDARLAPANGTFERVRLQEWLAYVGTEIHKGVGALFDRSLGDEAKAALKDRAGKRLAFIDQALAGKSYLMGENFTVADAYLFTCVRWTHFFQMDLSPWPNLAAFMARVGERPAVKAALEAEKG